MLSVNSLSRNLPEAMPKIQKPDIGILKGNDKRRAAKNKIFRSLVILFAFIATTPILLILFELIRRGMRQINFNFFTKVAPDSWEAMTALSHGKVIPGGILNGISGTFIMVFVASLIAIPIGILIGIYLYGHGEQRYTNILRDISDILQGAPSIVLGIIAYIWVVKYITHGYSALAGSASLAIMMLPLIIRSTEETFKMIPVSIIEAGLALGRLVQIKTDRRISQCCQHQRCCFTDNPGKRQQNSCSKSA